MTPSRPARTVRGLPPGLVNGPFERCFVTTTPRVTFAVRPPSPGELRRAPESSAENRSIHIGVPARRRPGGSATSQCSQALLWRRVRDSNPWNTCVLNDFRDGCTALLYPSRPYESGLQSFGQFRCPIHRSNHGHFHGQNGTDEQRGGARAPSPGNGRTRESRKPCQCGTGSRTRTLGWRPSGVPAVCE